LICGLPALAVACGGAPPTSASLSQPSRSIAQPKEASATTPASFASCERRRPGEGPVRLGASHGAARQSSSVALARLGATTLAYVADEDDSVLHTINVDTRAELATTPLAGTPAQILILADGRVAVTLRDRNQVEILEP